MSLEAILARIEAEGEAALEKLQRETEAQIEALQAEAQREAAQRREAARQAALEAGAAERAQRLHRARLQALQVTAAAREEVVAEALTQTQARLAQLRRQAGYAEILERLVTEALRALGTEEARQAVLAVDPRDEARVQEVLRAMDLDLPVHPELETWGGVVARSSDGRIVITNTLESRLERATPHLRREVASLLDV